MPKKVKANGKTFTFEDDVTNEQIGIAIDEYFAGVKKKVATQPTAPKKQLASPTQTQPTPTLSDTEETQPPVESDGLGGPPKMKTFTGFTPEEQQTLQAKPVPKISKTSLVKKLTLERELATTKVTPENQEEILRKTEELVNLNKEQEKLSDARLSEIEQQFKAAKDEGAADIEADKRLNDALTTTGIWNNVKAASLNIYNKAVDEVSALTDEPGIKEFKADLDPLSEEKKQVRKDAAKNKIELSDVEVEEQAKQLYKNKQKDYIETDNINSFLDNLDENDKNLLKQSRKNLGEHLQESNIKEEKVINAYEVVGNKKIKEYNTIEQELLKYKNNNQPFPKELYDSYVSLGFEIKGISNNISKRQDIIQKNREDLGTARQEFDLLKRQYGDVENFLMNTGTMAQKLAVNTLGGLDYLATVGGMFGDKEKNLSVQKDVIEINAAIDEQRSNLRKSVESIESPEGFVNYVSDIMANQIPSLVATSTGIGGLATIGVSTAGEKYADMNREVLEGKATYSPLQMASVPFLYGSAEVISEIPTLSILKKGGRVIDSVVKNEGDLIKKSVKEKAKEWAKDWSVDTGKEVVGEEFTNFAQNFTDKYVLGKKDVGLLDNAGTVFKDTVTLTSILKAAPHVAGAILKSHQNSSDLNILDENSRKIIEFSKQLDSSLLTDTEKSVISKQMNKLVSKNSEITANTIDKVNNMPDDVYKKIIDLNNNIADIKTVAVAINDGNLPNKAELIKSLESDYRTAQTERNALIDAKYDVVAEEVVAPTEVVAEEVVALTEVAVTPKIELKEGEEFIDSAKDNKGRTYTYVSETSEKDGLKTTKFKFNRSDKDSSQRNPAGVEADKVLDKYGFEIAEDEIPEGDEITKIYEIRDGLFKGERSVTATVLFKDPETGGTFKGEVRLTPKSKVVPTEVVTEEALITPTEVISPEIVTEEATPVEDVTTKPTTSKEVKSKYDATYDDNGNITKITTKKGVEVKQFIEYEVFDKKIGKKVTKLMKNPGYTQIEAKILGVITNNKSKVEQEKAFRDALDKFTPTTEYEVALEALAKGIKVSNPKQETGDKAGWATDKKADSIEVLAEKLAEEHPELDQQNIRNELIDIINSNSSLADVRSMLVSTTSEESSKLKQQEANAYLGSLTDKELAMYEAIKAEDDYISELSDEEAINYYQELYKQQDEGQIDESTGVKGVSAKEVSRKQEVAKKITAAEAKIDDIANWLKDNLPGADINPNDYKAQGFSQNQLIDIISDAAKKLSSTGIEISEAINQVIETLKQRFDFDIDVNLVKQRFVKPTKEVSRKQEEAFRDKVKDIPESGKVSKYLSGETIERVEGEAPRNIQEIDVMPLVEAGMHGKETVAMAKEVYGDNYIEKTLEFLDTANLKAHEKALLYVSLENEMFDLVKTDPSLKKLQDLVRAKSQQFLRESSLAINMGRLRAIMKDGFNYESITDGFLSTDQLIGKKEVEKAIQSDANAIQKEYEGMISESDLEQLVLSGVEKQINEIYKKLPTARRVKADKAIAALERIQKKLKGKAYDATIGLPIALIDSGITVIKNSIKAGVNIADAIELGINHIKEKHGKDWANEGVFRDDMTQGFKSEGVSEKEMKAKELSNKDIVNQALIEAGFGKEITVKKEKRNVLDWKKLAGEEGSVDKLRENVEKIIGKEAAKELEDEYNNLRASIIEKSLNELERRNIPRKKVNLKTSAKKLAEIYNYGAFEKDSDTYDQIMNTVLGMNELDQKSFNEAKKLAKSLAELFSQKDNEGNQLNQAYLKHAERVINKQIERLLSKVAWSESNGVYKAVTVAKEFVGLAQRNALVSVAQAVENTTSGYISRAFKKIGFMFDNVDTKALKASRNKLAKMTFKDITLGGGLEFGDVTSPFITKSKTMDLIVNASDSRLYHALASTALGKPFLESADSMHKAALAQGFFHYNLIKILRKKGYSKVEAKNYVSEQLTGQSFKDALVTSKQIIDKINQNAGKKVIPDSKESIYRFANDLVNEALVQGNKITLDELEASLKSAETVAGFELGHEPNNIISKPLNLFNSWVQTRTDKAVKDKKWNDAAALTAASIVTTNILNPYVGGGTNWTLLAAQKAGIPTLSTIYWNIKSRGRKLDLSTEEGMKNLEKDLKYQLLAKNANTRMFIGAAVTLAAFALAKSTGADDDLYEWLKKNKWANKYMKKTNPPAVQFMLAQKDKKLGEFLGQQMNIKADAFDEGKKLQRALKNAASGKTQQALGGVGQLAGSRLSTPIIPWRVVKDVRDIYRGLNGLPEIKHEFKASGFASGYFQGGMVEQLGLRPEDVKDVSGGRQSSGSRSASGNRESSGTRTQSGNRE